MKIIDILNKKANGELEDGFKFKFGEIYTYNKDTDSIRDREGISIGNFYCIENLLDCEVEVIGENKGIEELPHEYYIKLKKGCYNKEDILNGIRTDLKMHQDKVNELVREVNKINKEREEK